MLFRKKKEKIYKVFAEDFLSSGALSSKQKLNYKVVNEDISKSMNKKNNKNKMASEMWRICGVEISRQANTSILSRISVYIVRVPD